MKYRIEYSKCFTRSIVTDCAVFELPCGCHQLEDYQYEFWAVSDELAMQTMERFNIKLKERSFAPNTQRYWITKLVRIDQEEKTSPLVVLDRGELKIWMWTASARRVIH